MLERMPTELVQRFLDASAEREGEQRLVTMLFVDLAQSTEIMRSLGAERMVDLLEELLDGIAQIAYGFEGTIIDVAGDGALCAFGAPIAHEDDAERALRAALAIRAVVAAASPRVAGTGHELAVRIGVHTGPVVVRMIGQRRRLKYSAVGDAVHLAQRLQGAAAPGEIVVSATTQRLAATPFRFSRPLSLALKGFGEGNVAFLLTGEHDTAERRAVDGSATLFVGRTGELGQLRDRIGELSTGRGGIVTVVGDAGIGKSRLIAEARRTLPVGYVWLEGRAPSYGQNMPYFIIGQLVRRAARIGDDDSERDARERLRSMIARETGEERAAALYPFIALALGMRPEPADAAATERYAGDELQREVLRALRELVVAVARRTPTVLVYEDVHWSDRASVAVIEELLTLVNDHPVLHVLAMRPDRDAPSWPLKQRIEERYPGQHTALALGPLSAEASAQLAGGVLGTRDLASDVRSSILGKAEGVPLFLEELTRALVEGGMLKRDGGAWRLTVAARDLRVPDTVEAAILARLDRLEHPVKRVLQIASVIGRVFNYRILAEVSHADGELQGPLQELQRLEFIREAPHRREVEYAFRHALIQDVAYQSLLGPRRHELHREVGEAMETLFADRATELRGIIAEHFLRGEEWAKAVELLAAAGDAAASLYAHAEARQHYTQALSALEHLPDTADARRRRFDLVIKRVRVSFIAEGPDRILSMMDDLEALARELPGPDGTPGSDRLRLARVQYWRGRSRYYRNELREAIGYYQQALAVAQELGDEELLAIPSSVIGQAVLLQGQFTKARALLAQGVQRLESQGNWAEWIRAAAYYGLAIAGTGDYAGGLAMVERALARATEMGSLTGIGVTGILVASVHFQATADRRVLDAARAAVEAAEQANDTIPLYAGLAYRAWAESRLGRHDDAFASMARSRTVGESIGGRLVLADLFIGFDAELHLNVGRFDEAIALAERAIDASKASGAAFAAALAHRLRARALAASGAPLWEADLEASLAALETGGLVLQIGETELWWGRLMRERGDPAGAVAHLEKAAARFEAGDLTAKHDEANAELALAKRKGGTPA
jgi:class 3 adenylate cyclase/tetratricopeptide (TPR) repeat protein